MKKNFLLVAICLFQISLFAQTTPSWDEKMAWWQDARFGMFIHWGLFSVAGGEWKGKPYKGNEHFMMYERVPLKEYATLATQFNPVKFDADSWVKTIKNAGMKYMVITTKHHEGFAMYNSPSSDYNIVKATPYHKDPMKALAESCAKYGIKLCFYYSLGRDWQDPDVPTNWPTKGGRSNTWDYPNESEKVFDKYFRRKVIPQVTELLTQYGQIGVLWFDTPELIGAAESKELRALVNKLQPNCIINERIGNNLGDFKVSEQKLDATNATANPWESCITMSKNWGYNRYDTVFKSPEVLIRNLIEVVSANGNFLLNIGPNGQGEITDSAIKRLSAVGSWMAVNGEAIYGTHAWTTRGENIHIEKEVPKKKSVANTMVDVNNDVTSQKTRQDILFTTKGKYLYLFARSWIDPEVLAKSLPTNKTEIYNVQLLGYKGKLSWKQNNEGLRIKLPTTFKPNIPIYTFKISLEH